jgi:hypothetical protein
LSLQRMAHICWLMFKQQPAPQAGESAPSGIFQVYSLLR